MPSDSSGLDTTSVELFLKLDRAEYLPVLAPVVHRPSPTHIMLSPRTSTLSLSPRLYHHVARALAVWYILCTVSGQLPILFTIARHGKAVDDTYVNTHLAVPLVFTILTPIYALCLVYAITLWIRPAERPDPLQFGTINVHVCLWLCCGVVPGLWPLFRAPSEDMQQCIKQWPWCLVLLQHNLAPAAIWIALLCASIGSYQPGTEYYLLPAWRYYPGGRETDGDAVDKTNVFRKQVDS
ncbi:hypothetical protein MIND_01422900 [Mycena indigotica]|uniref:Uncharacterized protein n=1 Tax=Mycena indigotica TaxID=2126181 RepID=A0A8H6RY12_9AGAR|nr:uncharacterized protein MIND_01422900 [Mycena indigotica]KAF7288773.1 hypothetical protein MIND_01422900 [Mycena indigotica]